ncbi:hypothetical protein ABPG72_021197 [Tetrahymena utriculariae]
MSKSMFEIIIDDISKLFRNTEAKGLKLFKSIIQENSIIDITMRLVQGYGLKDTQDKMIKLFTEIPIISQKKNFVQNSTKNPNLNIILTFYSSSEEFQHSRLRSIREQYLSLPRLRQKKLDSDFSNRIEQKTIINMDTEVRSVAYKLLLNSFLLKVNIIIYIKIATKLIIIGIINVIIRSVYPILADSLLQLEIKQLKEKNEELKGLYNKNYNQKRAEMILTLVNQFVIKQTQI